MAITKVGLANSAGIGFGVTSVGEPSNQNPKDSTITSFTRNETQEVKELRGSDGQVIGAAFYKKKQDITIEFIGAPSLSVAIASDLQGGDYDSQVPAEGNSFDSNDEILVDEVTTDISAEGHRTTNVKATRYFAQP